MQDVRRYTRPFRSANREYGISALFVIAALFMEAALENRAWGDSKNEKVICSEIYGGEFTECQVSTCPSDFEKYLGVWEGRSESFDVSFDSSFDPSVDPKSSRAIRVVFSKNTCLKNELKSEDLLVGKQTEVEARTEKSGSKVANVLWIYGRNKDRRVDFVRTVGSQGQIAEFNLVSKDENKGLRTYRADKNQWPAAGQMLVEELSAGQEREIRTTLTDASGKIMARGVKRALSKGDVSYFAGSSWIFSSRGDLVGINDSLLSRNTDPERGQVTQTETLYLVGNKKVEPTERHSALVVTQESMGTLENVKNARWQYRNGNALESIDVETTDSLYSEERLKDSQGKVLMTFMRTAARIDRDEYDKRIDALFKNCAKCTLRR